MMLTAVYLILAILAAWCGIGVLVSRHPFQSAMFLLGTLATEVVIMALAYVLVLQAIGAGLTSAIAPAIWLTFIELAVVTAIAILFGSFTSPVLSALRLSGIAALNLPAYGLTSDKYGKDCYVYTKRHRYKNIGL